MPERAAPIRLDHRAPRERSTIACLAALLLVSAAVVGWPGFGVVADALRYLTRADAEPLPFARALRPLFTSLGVAIGIGALAAACAWPLAWVLASSNRWRLLAPLLLTPLALPHTLAFTGWGVARSPDTLLGDLIVSAAHDGARWLPIFVGRALAVVGLALWAAPLAAIVQATSTARTPHALIETARLAAPPGPRRHAPLVRMHAPAIAASIGLVAAVMLGSAVPLHLAQLPTSATVLWLELAETPAGQRGRVWLMATPTLALAVLAAGVITRSLFKPASSEDAPDADPPRTEPATGIAGVLIWALAVLIPAGLMAITVGDWTVVGRFLSVHGEAVAHSAGVAACVGASIAAIGALSGVCFSSNARPVRIATAALLAVFLSAALIPGVLIGAAFASSATAIPQIRETAIPIAAAHVARFGALGMLAGLISESLEPPALRALRRADGAVGLGPWCRAVLPRRWPLIAGAGVAAACLSLHEIEAAVMVQPPGPGNLAQLLLDALHFARQDVLAAGMLHLAGTSFVAALLAAAGVYFNTRAGNRSHAVGMR